jgi:opacity protein-like surface antigen
MVHVFAKVLITGAAVCALAVAGLSGVAQAADLDQPIFIEQAPEVQPVEIGNGWYLRADVGYALETQANGDFEYRTFGGGIYSDQLFDTGSLSSSLAFGGGVGYRITDYFRVDGTVDAFQTHFEGSTSAASPCLPTDPVLAGTECRTTDSQTMNAYQFMANAYVDLGTFMHFTPYVGAGVGMTYTVGGALTNTLFCVDGAAACPAAYVDTVTHAGSEDFRFTYALMGGVSYEATKNVSFDLGYRYSRVAGGDMFKFDQDSIDAGASGVQGKDNGFDRHEIRVGVRYALW